MPSTCGNLFLIISIDSQNHTWMTSSFVLVSRYRLNLLLHQLQIGWFIDSIGCTLIHFCSRGSLFLNSPRTCCEVYQKASCSFAARDDSTPTEHVLESSMPALDSYLCKGLGLMKLTTYPRPIFPLPSRSAQRGLFNISLSPVSGDSVCCVSSGTY